MSDNLSTASDIATIVQAIWPILILIAGGSVTAAVAILRHMLKKERRLVSNLKRPVAVVPSSKDSMEHEVRLLKDVEFFNIDSLAADGRSADLITDRYRLVVIRYEKGSEDFWHVYEQLAAKQIPVIVYSKPLEIDMPTDINRIQKYSLHALCNTPVRLISDVSAIMATYPEGK